MAKVNVTILNMEKELFKGTCDIAVFQGEEGQLAVLPGHTRLVTPLRKGAIVLKTGERATSFDINRGFLYVDKQQVNVLVE